MAEMNRGDGNRNRKEQQIGHAAGRKRRRGLEWPGTARAGTHGPVPAGACMQGGRDDGSQQHTAGNRRPGGSTGQEFSVLLPGRTGGSSGLQVRSTCACTQGKGGARSGGNGGRGLGPAAAWLAARKKQQGGGVYIGGDGELLACAPREGSGLGRRGSGCEEKKKRNGPDC